MLRLLDHRDSPTGFDAVLANGESGGHRPSSGGGGHRPVPAAAIALCRRQCSGGSVPAAALASASSRAAASASSSARSSAKCTWLEHRAGSCRRDSLIGAVWWPRAGRSTLGDTGADARQGRSVRLRICTATSGGIGFGQAAPEPGRERSEPTGSRGTSAFWTTHVQLPAATCAAKAGSDAKPVCGCGFGRVGGHTRRKPRHRTRWACSPTGPTSLGGITYTLNPRRVTLPPRR